MHPSKANEKMNSKNENEPKTRKGLFFYLIRGFFSIIVLTLFLIVINFENIFLEQSVDQNSIGIIKQKDGVVRIRRPGSPNWEALHIDDFIPAQSLVLSDKGAKATYVLLDGTVINQTSETLLKLDLEMASADPVRSQIKIELTRGDVEVNTPAAVSEDDFRSLQLNSKKFKMDRKSQSTVKFNRNQQRKSLKLAVLDGEVGVEAKDKKFVQVRQGEEIENIARRSVETEPLEKQKKKIPKELLDQYKKEAEKNNYEDLQQEVYRSRSLSRILDRIFSALFY